MNEQKKLKNKKALRIGSFSIGLSVLVLAIVIAANLLVGSLPAWIIHPDTTPEGMFTIGETTKDIVADLETDVTLYHIAQSANVDTVVEEILQRYADLSSRIKVTQIDPATNPTFVSEYTKAEKLAENSIIAVSDKRSTVINGSSLYMYKLPMDDANYYTQSEYDAINQQYAMYYGQYISATQYFFGENELTRAIDYVAADAIPVLYTVGGHGETEFGETFTSAVADENVELRDLTLISGEKQEVPEDAAAVLLYMPQTDISEEELTILKTYLTEGGNILLSTYYTACTADTMPNLAALTEYMGLSATANVVMEGDTAKYSQYPYYIIPTLGTEGLCQNLASTNINTLMIAAHPITNTQSNENVTAVPLMTTSDKAFLDQNESETGTYTLAWEATLNDGGKLIWFGSPSVLDENVLSVHAPLLAATLQQICEKTSAVSIVGKNIPTATLDITQADATTWFTVMVIAVPLIPLVTGFVIWLGRRRK